MFSGNYSVAFLRGGGGGCYGVSSNRLSISSSTTSDMDCVTFVKISSDLLLFSSVSEVLLVLFLLSNSAYEL